MNRVQQKIINQALEEDDKLTDWEYDFINTLADRDDSYTLSDKENEILNRIHGKLDY